MLHALSRFSPRFIGLLLVGPLLIGLLAGVSPLAAADWPQWRGPNRDGLLSPEHLPAKWPDELQPRWRLDVGEGHSGPVVLAGRVYQHARDGEDEVVRCLDLQSGKVLWTDRQPVEYEMNGAALSFGKGPRSTPVVADDKLVVFSVTGRVTTFNAKSGKRLWQQSFASEFQNTAAMFGTSMSPVIHQGHVIVHAGGDKNGALFALKLENGKPAWKLGPDGPAYTSPVLVPGAKARIMITQTQANHLAFNAKTGQRVWQLPFTTVYDQTIITPVFYKDLVILAGVEQPTTAWRLKGTSPPQKVWEADAFPLYMSSPVVIGDQLYGLSHKRKGLLFCLNPATGKEHWSNEGRTAESASLVAGGGVVLVATTDGELLVYRDDVSRDELLHTYQVANSMVWAHPAYTGSLILVKGERELVAWDAGPVAGK